MPQYKTGIVSVTNGSNTVNFSGASSGAESVAVGDTFKVDRNGEAIYQISSRTPSSGASLTSITLSTNYAGTTGSGLGYQITTDFTPYRGYPELAQGDADAADWITNALRKIDRDIGTGVIGGGTSTSATAGSQTLPSNPAGFVNVIIAGVARKIPYYNV